MTPEEELKQLIKAEELVLTEQAVELESLFKEALENLQWKNILKQSYATLVRFEPIQQWLISFAVRFAAFKIIKSMWRKS